MHLDIIEPALKTLIASLSHPTPSRRLYAFMEDEPREMVDTRTQGIVLLSMPAIVTHGVDDRVLLVDLDQPLGEELADAYRGLRELTLTIKVESYDQSPGFAARAYCERIRSGLGWASSRAALRAVDLSLGQTMNTVDLSRDQDGHRVSVAALDAILNVAVHHQDPVRFGYVERVQVRDITSGVEVDVELE